MARTVFGFMIVAAVLVLLSGGCSKRETPSALYILEELEAASALKDPAERVERYKIFIANHADHPYRFLAYGQVFETMAREMKDEAKAQNYLSSVLAKETDSVARGELLLDKFSYLIERDKERALAFADTLMDTERSPRLFLYLGYYLIDAKAAPDLAVECFLKSADLSTKPYEKSQAMAQAGACLEEQGKKEEARRYLAMATGNPEADELMGRLLWDEGKRSEAIEKYIQCAARMPGARKFVKLDSLYTLVDPDAKNLDKKILAQRIGDEGPFPDARFVDLDGKVHDLSKLRGTKLVINVLSPT
jgi:tetratricopeptide (TPR) repeat protein